MGRVQYTVQISIIPIYVIILTLYNNYNIKFLPILK